VKKVKSKIVAKKNLVLFQDFCHDQEIFHDTNLEYMKILLGKGNLIRLRNKIIRQISDLQEASAFFNLPSISKPLVQIPIPSLSDIKEGFFSIYPLLNGDIKGFIDQLNNNLFPTNIKKNVDDAVDDSKKMIELLFDHEEEFDKNQFLFAVANHMFEFCFYPKTFPYFKKMLLTPSQYSKIKLMYSIIWSNLCEVGWQNWHKNCLDSLVKEAGSKEVLYIAGGTDIYQLLKRGIYNIKVVDPMLSSQPKYYSENWKMMIDTEHLSTEAKIYKTGLTIKKIEYKKTGKSFSVDLSNKKKEEIPESIITFEVKKAGKKVGNLIFDRRLAKESDFSSTKNPILISFNELNFVTSPKNQEGWGMNVENFPENIKVFVKQLRQTVDKKIMLNLRYEARHKNFSFISLGTCVN
jgi:hypothetical protein